MNRLTPTAEQTALIEEILKAPYPVTFGIAARKLGTTPLEAARLMPESAVAFVEGDAAERFAVNPPRNKEEYLYRTMFAAHFPSDSAAASVPSVPSVACSTAEALAWDESFKGQNEPSGRAVADVHL